MPAFSLLTDSIICLIVYVCTASLTLKWVHRTNQDRVQKKADVTWSILIRLAVIVGGLFVGCWLINLATWVSLLALGLLTMFVLAGDSLGLPVAAAFWMVQQYVLGFPDCKELFLAPPAPLARDDTERVTPTCLVGHEATVLSPLKPTGEIVVGETRHTATSENGRYMDPGELVVVSRIQDGMVMVRGRGDSHRNA